MATTVSCPVWDKDTLAIEHLPLVKQVARKIHGRLPVRVSLEDLIQQGVIGLLTAIARFDPSRGVALETYAEYKIKGSILDSLRKIDLAPRGKRRLQKLFAEIKTELSTSLQRTPTDEEMAHRLDMTVEIFRKKSVRVSLATGSLVSLSSSPKDDDDAIPVDIPCPTACHPDVIVSSGRIVEFMKLIGPEIGPTHWLVIVYYYWEEMTMQEIAKALKIHESRVSQVHDDALNRLSAVLYSRGIVRMSQLLD